LRDTSAPAGRAKIFCGTLPPLPEGLNFLRDASNRVGSIKFFCGALPTGLEVSKKFAERFQPGWKYQIFFAGRFQPGWKYQKNLRGVSNRVGSMNFFAGHFFTFIRYSGFTK
jgi:hypothetical protein